MQRDRYFLLLLMLGIYLPTSTNGSGTYLQVVLSYAIGLGLLVYAAMKLGASESALLWCFFPTLMILCSCTLIGSLEDVRPSKLGIYGTTALMLCLRWKPHSMAFGRHTLCAFSLVNIVVGTGILVGWEPITDFINRWYAAFLPDLVETMVASGKPVLTYGTHSLAAFFLYLFYWLNFATFQETGNKVHLALAVSHALLCAAVASHTSFVFAALAFGEMLWRFLLKAKQIAIATIISAALFLPSLAQNFDSELQTWTDIGHAIRELLVFTWTAKEGGIAGRFGAGGDMRAPLAYLGEHPLLPIGISTRPEYTLGDSGPIEYMVRGSVPLLVLIYGGLWFFLRAHMRRTVALRFFFCVVIMEIGFSVLTYHRTIFLLPASLLYLSSLRLVAEQPIAKHVS